MENWKAKGIPFRLPVTSNKERATEREPSFEMHESTSTREKMYFFSNVNLKIRAPICYYEDESYRLVTVKKFSKGKVYD